jgi:hypothetical protein
MRGQNGFERLGLEVMWLLFLSLCGFTEIRACAATQTGFVLQTGLHYDAVKNLSLPEAEATVFQGRAGNQGYAHDSIILAPNARYREWILQVSTGGEVGSHLDI